MTTLATRPPVTQAPIKDRWSGVEAVNYGPYFEAKMARLAHLVWGDPAAKAAFLADPKAVLAREVQLHLPAGLEVKVIEEGEGGVEHFVVPVSPPTSEFYYRFEQIAGWWMMAHGFTWWMSRLENGDQAFRMLDALQIMIIGHIWNDPAFRARMLADPKAALEADSGAIFPPMKSWEDTATRIHLVLPKAPTAHEVRGEFGEMGRWFMTAHTWWWWLLTARMYAPAKASVSDLVS